MNVVSDTVIALSYIAISATLAMLVNRAKRDIPFSWVFLAFGLFIVACGGTHLMEAVTVWVPLYWLSADIKIVTALASLATAISLPRLVPKTISLLAASKVAAESKLQLEEANARLLGLTQDATARLASIVEGSEDAIFAYRLDGVITDWNQAATRLYGYSAEEAIGHNLSFLVPPSRSDELTEILNTVAAGGRIQQFETVRQRKDGSLIDVSFSVSPITGQDGTIIGGSAIVRDITSRKRMEEAAAAKRRAIPVGGARYQGCYLGLGHWQWKGMAERDLTGNTSGIRRETRNPTWWIGKSCFTLKIEIVFGMDSRPHCCGDPNLMRSSIAFDGRMIPTQ